MREKRVSSSMLPLYAMTLLTAISGNILGPIMSIYARDYAGATAEEVGIIASVFSIVSMPSKIASGFYGRGRGTFYLPVAGMIISSVCPLAMALSALPSTLMIFRAFQGFGNALIWSPLLTLVAIQATGSRRDKAIGTYTFSTSLGMSIGPLIGSLSVATFGVRNTFFVSSVVSAASLLPGLMLIRSRQTFGVLEREDNEQVSRGETIHVLGDRSFQFAFTILVAESFVYGVLLAYGTLYAKDVYRVSDQEVVFIFFGYNGILMLMRLLLGQLVNLNKRKAMALALFNCTGMVLLLLLSNNYLMFAIFFSILGASHGIIFPMGAMSLAESIPRGLLSVANAIYVTAWDVGATLGPMTTAPLVSTYTYRGPIMAASLVPMIGLGIAVLIHRRRSTSVGCHD